MKVYRIIFSDTLGERVSERDSLCEFSAHIIPKGEGGDWCAL